MDSTISNTEDPSSNGGWHKVSYPKRHRRAPPPPPSQPIVTSSGGSHVFASVEMKAEERRRAIEAAAAAAESADWTGTTARSDDDSDGDLKENGGSDVAVVNEKKAKEKKPKKPKITVADAASKIDADDLSAHLVDILGSYESQQDIQLMRFTDYFGKAFAGVSGSQFPWTKMFKESPVSKIINVPLCHISDAICRTSADWISQKSADALNNFVLWCLDSILMNMVSLQAVGKGTKKSVQQPPSKSQVAIFVVLAMTLRRKPDVLVSLLPELRENPKYQGHEKFPLIVWVIGQASQGDLVIGMYAWIHYLLLSITGKPSVNPQSRDLALQLVESFLSVPKARSILLNGAVRKGERLVPPSSLDLLMRATFPTQSARVKATERFEAIYPTLKELALAGSPGTKTTKQASQQLFPLSVKAMQENNTELTKEAADIFIWCLVQNPDCYKQWENLHLDNVGASVAVLYKLSDEWKEYSTKLSPFDQLRLTIKNLREQNEGALAGASDAGKQASIKAADKHCKVILGRISRGSVCIKGGVLMLVIAVAVGFSVSPNVGSWDLQKFHSMLTSTLQSF